MPPSFSYSFIHSAPISGNGFPTPVTEEGRARKGPWYEGQEKSKGSTLTFQGPGDQATEWQENEMWRSPRAGHSGGLAGDPVAGRTTLKVPGDQFPKKTALS